MSEMIRLTYRGWLPNMNGHEHWRSRYRLRQLALRTFGRMPFPETRHAHVTITRVLGPRQRLMDVQNFSYQMKGLQDSLRNDQLRTKKGQPYIVAGGQYIVDDSPAHATLEYPQDDTRRAAGPCIEVTITYEETSP